jgi:phosphoglycerol transferase MdoB-like AlkP superfamily enzyme
MRWLVFIALVFLVLMSLARLILFVVYTSPQQTFGSSLPAFWLGLRYDLRDVGILSVVLLLLGSVPFLNPFSTRLGKVVWFVLLWVATVVFIFTYAFDFQYYSYLSQRLNASVLTYMGDTETSLSMIWESYHVIRIFLLILGLTLVIMVILRWGYRRWAGTTVNTSRGAAWAWGVLLFVLLGGGIFGHLGQYPLRWSDAFSLSSDREAQLALNPFQSFFSSMKFRKQNYSKAVVKADYPLMAEYLGVADPDSTRLNFTRTVPATPTTRPNIVLVICESFSGYKSSMWGNPLNTTPFFDSLCRQGVFFDHCFTPHYGTARGVWATVTGIPDVAIDNTSSRNPQAVDQHSIMNDLSGYEKYYFIGGSASWANIRGVLENNLKGLHLFEENDYSSPRLDVWGISDKNLFMEANKVLRKPVDKPFFAIIQTSDNHRPYTIPSEDRKDFHEVGFPQDTLHKYGFEQNEELNAFRYTDYCYRYLIETARKESYFRNTVFVFIGDHGIRGDAGDMLPRAWTDQALTCFHVPLLFYAPGLLSPVRHTMNCSQVDVMPSIAGLTGDAYTNTTLGRDLFQKRDTTSNVSFIMDHDAKEIGVVNNGYYYLRQLTGGKEQLVSIRGNDPLPADKATDSLENRMRHYTDAFYETARYLLLNNHKNP